MLKQAELLLPSGAWLETCRGPADGQAGISGVAVAEMLGHSSASTSLDIYRHAFDTSAGVAVAAVERAILRTRGPVQGDEQAE